MVHWPMRSESDPHLKESLKSPNMPVPSAEFGGRMAGELSSRKPTGKLGMFPVLKAELHLQATNSQCSTQRCMREPWKT